MSHIARLTCALAVSGLALFAQVAPVPNTIETTGMAGIAEGQTAQLNLLNPGVLPPATGVACTAAVSFIDSTGTVVKSATLVVLPGKSNSLAVRSDIDLKLTSANDRREVRATIAIPSIVPPPTASSTAPITACKLIPTLEIFDTSSGRTLVTLGHVTALPAVPTATP